jgi:hypothetical protein
MAVRSQAAGCPGVTAGFRSLRLHAGRNDCAAEFERLDRQLEFEPDWVIVLAGKHVVAAEPTDQPC